jgi:hypothetical protein
MGRKGNLCNVSGNRYVGGLLQNPAGLTQVNLGFFRT